MVTKILICDSLESQGVELLREAGFEVDEKPTISSQELLANVPDYDAIVVRSRTKVTREIIEAGQRLKAIARAGVGLDNVDVDSAKRRGVQVISTPNAPTTSVAELAVALMLDVLRQMSLADRSMKEGKWIKSKLSGRELRGKTVGVIGAGGRIGAEVCRILRQGFGADVIGYDVVDIRQRGAELGIRVANDLEELLTCSDIVTIHVPYSPTTHHFLDEKRISGMKKGSILINTSRGDIVDGSALLRALREKRLSGAGLDVFHNEPPAEDWEKELVSLPDGATVCTCHIGAQTTEAQNAASRIAAELLTKALRP